MSTTILAIESSCDDTSAAIIRDGKLLSNITDTQDAHKNYGGVVPELASRAHLSNIIPVIDMALEEAKVSLRDLSAVGVTGGPGLMGSLLVGVTTAKAIALSLDIPLIEVHHMEAHILAHFIDEPRPQFPFLCLTVSGGHTQIVRVESPSKMILMGSTRDDAAGEAFDKTGKILGLPYPAGPIIDKYAQKGEAVFSFPRPNIPDYDFSFSGLKTAILYFLRERKKENPNFVEEHMANICASVQSSIVEILLDQLERAAKDEHLQQIAIAGGVSANSHLRTEAILRAEKLGWDLFTPEFQYCTDNAGMIAMAAHFKWLNGDFSPLDMSPKARWSLNFE